MSINSVGLLITYERFPVCCMSANGPADLDFTVFRINDAVQTNTARSKCRHNLFAKVKVKVNFAVQEATKAQRWSRGIALLFPLVRSYMGWVVNATPRPLYPRDSPGTHCIGGWVSPRVVLDGCGKCRSHSDSIPEQSSP